MAGGEVMPDTVSYNTALKACGNAMQLQEALQVRSPATGRRASCCALWVYPLEFKGSAFRHALAACTKCCPLCASRDCRCHPTQCTNQ